MTNQTLADLLVLALLFIGNARFIFDVLSWKSPVGEKGERLRLFLSDVGYAKARASEKRGEIKIRKHAAVIEGHILPDRRKRRH